MYRRMIGAILAIALLIAAAHGMTLGTISAEGEDAAAGETGTVPGESADAEKDGSGNEQVDGTTMAANEGSTAARVEAEVPSGWTKAAENERLSLYLDEATAEFAVKDNRSGEIWFSNPADRESDKTAKGAKKMDLSSQLLIDYVDDLNKPFQANSLTGGVKEVKPVITAIDNGTEIVFEFPKAGFKIPVRYTLGDDYLSASVMAEAIEQSGKYKLANVSLLPFFGAGGLADQGYLFVPDGSGALIHFNNGKSGYRSYNERVYGGDAALDYPVMTERKEAARLPVFGMRKGNAGFLAVIASGEYQAGITAEVSGKSNSYNNVYSYMSLMEIESNVLLEGTPNEKQVTRFSDSLTGGEPFEVRYYLLNGETESSYAGMANRYKAYLQEELGVKPSDEKAETNAEKPLPMLVDFLGGAKKRKTFLGFPYSTVETLTSFKDVSAAAEELLSEGVTGLSIRLSGWNAGGAMDEVQVSLRAESKLGGSKGLLRLSKELQEKGVSFYPAADPVRLYEGGNGFSKFMDSAKGISRAPALKFEYRLSDGTKDKSAERWYLMKPASAAEAVERYVSTAADKELHGIALQSIASTVYSDFKRGSLSKNETGRIWEEALKEAAGKSSHIMFDHPNAYVFPYAGALTDVPLYDSGFDVTDEAVPFYSIAVSGLIPSYSEPLNLSSTPRDYLLKLIETGTYPAYQFIARKSSLLSGTAFDHLYSSEYGLWREELLRQYEELSAVMKDTAGNAIANHQKLAEGVYETTYENGKKAIVNYNDKNADAYGLEIPANGYLIR